MFEQYGILGLAIAGCVQALKEALPVKVTGFVTIIAALAIGLLAGFSGLNDLTPLAAGLTPISGILVAFATIGLMAAIDRLAGKKTPPEAKSIKK
jgi:hypothetical protein